MTCEYNETFSRDDLERIVFYELSRHVFRFTLRNRSSEVISDDRLRRSLSLEDPEYLYYKSMLFYHQLIPFLYFAVPTPTPIKATTGSTTPGTSTALVFQLLLIAPVANDCNFQVIFV